MTTPKFSPGPAGSALRGLPRTDRLVDAADRAGLVETLGRGPVLEAVRAELDRHRAAVLAGEPCPSPEAIEAGLLDRLREDARGSLRPVVNATGVVIHTNLGRAPLSEAAIAAMGRAARGYANLEYDLAEGERGDRYGHAEAPLCRLTGAEAAVAVNNNASAVMLALAALMDAPPDRSGGGEAGVRPLAAPGRGEAEPGLPEVIVSRGQLVEIGGGFRIPDVLRRSGAALVEVGTTNRTYLRDHEAAVGPRTRILLAVHRSNFRLSGFVHDTPLEELVDLGRRRALWVVDDLGSGTLLETAPFGLGAEPTVQERIRAGADLVCFSGDKLLGGPQAGILCGTREAIARVKRHPLMRALRVDKVTLAALSATLAHYERGEALEQVPVWRAIAAAPEALEARARGWLAALGPAGAGCAVRPSRSAVGGGSLPEVTLPTSVLSLPGAPDALAARLRRADPPVIGRIEEDRVVLDARTVMPGEDEALIAAVRTALAG
ncbi:L-seryl-tRNA(Sec) selenium transferase [Anaeromyxobacter dehalogenans]|uniref:L-seryl-tRNA(Sec) selenium transferase n=1 Tax=Anaeromyxobacter dehalogenans (strain 2CP-C) TaxID=290397 RepID=Q2IN06_ANADE|nr:L-seryl-tRNA(Sec) selenium transferase [Anaeromyxobacter dehalogenans]ABC80188.1 L-seryl-tRNA(Sec) selenium transferase [Anaeromyxobacter dehalogenans 2CP-C]